jgi:hypothetical protein
MLRLRVRKGDEGVGGVREVLCLLMTVLCFFMTVIGVVHFGRDGREGNEVL